MQINLFTGPDCCLCDDAKALINSLEEHQRPDVIAVNIREHPHYYHLYAVRIPVLKRLDNDRELGWPFDRERLIEFLS